jgi:glycosyltransferase involved in cell wall biosynthesis
LRRAIRADALDVFFAPAYTAPLGLDVPLAVTIHDVSFFAHPEWFRPEEGVRRRWFTARAAGTARVVFTVSAFSRAEIERYQLAEPERIRVIPPGVTAPVVPPNVQREPLILFVGSLFNRRRLPDLISAFARATSDLPSARLVLVGPDRTWPPQDLRAMAIDRGVSSRTDILSYATPDTLATLYARASVFAFLSEYEGFGLTPLEAMAAGIPPVVLDTPVAREVYSDAAFFVERDDVRGTAEVLRRLLTDPSSAKPVLSRAAEVLHRYSWDTTASRTLDDLERIAGR